MFVIVEAPPSAAAAVAVARHGNYIFAINSDIPIYRIVFTIINIIVNNVAHDSRADLTTHVH